MSRSRSIAHTFPSPIFPVRAAAATMSTIFSAWLESTSASIFTLGTNSIWYSEPLNVSFLPPWRP